MNPPKEQRGKPGGRKGLTKGRPKTHRWKPSAPPHHDTATCLDCGCTRTYLAPTSHYEFVIDIDLEANPDATIADTHRQATRAPSCPPQPGEGKPRR